MLMIGKYHSKKAVKRYASLHTLIIDWLLRGSSIEKRLCAIYRRLKKMAETLDDIISVAGDIKAELSKMPEHFEKIRALLEGISTGDPETQAKIDEAIDELNTVLGMARTAESTADELDGE